MPKPKCLPCFDLTYFSLSLFLFVFLTLDLFINTTLFVTHYTREVSLFHVSLFERYSIGTSCVDVWITSLLKIALFSSILFSLCVSKETSYGRIKGVKSFVYLLLLVMNLWIFLKLLASFEFYSDGSSITNTSHVNVIKNSTQINNNKSTLHPVLWAMLSWNVVTDITYFCVLYGFVNLKESRVGYLQRSHLNRHVNINEESLGEGAPLLREEPLKDKADEKEKLDDENYTGKFKGMILLLSFCKPDIPYLAVAFSFLLIAAVGSTFTPYYLGQVINHVVVTADLSSFYYSLIILSVIEAISSVTSGLRALTFGYALSRLNIRIRSRLFGAIVRQEIGFFDENLTGDITSRLTADTQQMSDQITINMNIFLRNVIQIIGSIVFMIILSWKLTISALIAIPITVYVYEYFGDLFKTVAKRIQDSLALANNVAEQVISSMRTVRSFSNEKKESDHYDSKLKVVFKYQVQESVIYGIFMIIIKSIDNCLVTITLLYGGYLVISHELSPGNLISYMFYWIALGECLDSIGDVYTGMMQAVGAAEKVFRIIYRKPKINHFLGEYAPGKAAGNVEFRDVKFSYPTRPEVRALDGVSFSVEQGKTVALVGPSGGGKSTCINLLERFYEPQEGVILLDGKPVSEYAHDNLHRQLSLVSQEPVLYARSVRENISYGVAGAVDLEEVKRAARWSNAHEFIVKLPQEYETETGEKGTQLSGGQKQRVAIARAILRDPSVLLLDEATSALDAESESLVQEALNKQMQGRSVLIIAHRLSTVENADNIIVIDEGKVMEEGSHAELMERGGVYSKLVYKQLLAGEERRNAKKMDRGDVRVQPAETEEDITNNKKL